MWKVHMNRIVSRMLTVLAAVGLVAGVGISVSHAQGWASSGTVAAAAPTATQASATQTSATLIDESFDAQTTPADFGFSSDATVSGGVLTLEPRSGAGHAAHRDFDPEVIGQKRFDLAFTWSVDAGDDQSGNGIELRDLYGRLLFALSGGVDESGNERIGVATKGAAVDESSAGKDSGLPSYTYEPADLSQTYAIALHADFTAKTVEYSVKDKDGDVVVGGTASTKATSLYRMYAVAYRAGGEGAQTIDDFTLTGTDTSTAYPLKGKRVYAFGDSLIDGFLYDQAGFVTFASYAEGFKLNDYARNGATILPSEIDAQHGGQILRQAANVSANTPDPDVIVFNGGTNDTPLDNTTAADEEEYTQYFEQTIRTFHEKWPSTPIIYVTAAKMGYVGSYGEQQLHDLELKLCRKWGVTVADVYANSGLDTRVDTQRKKYSFDELDANGLPGTPETVTYDDPSKQPSGIHPNLDGIEKFYQPIFTKTLRAVIAAPSAPVDPSAGRGELQDLVDTASALSEADFEAEEWPAFASALANAKNVLGSGSGGSGTMGGTAGASLYSGASVSGASGAASDAADGRFTEAISNLRTAMNALRQKATTQLRVLYNPHNGDHLYTTSLAEYNRLISLEWQGQGLDSGFPVASSGAPGSTALYRVYNPNNGEHLLVAHDEAKSLTAIGWTAETGADGITGTPYCYLPQNGTVPVYRLYNPTQSPSNADGHYYTPSATEASSLVQAGWTLEQTLYTAEIG